MAGVIPEGELFEAEGKGYLFRFAGGQGYSGEALQATDGLFEASAAVTYVALDYFRGGDVALCVGDGDFGSDEGLRTYYGFADRDGLAGEGYGGVDELRVGKARSRRGRVRHWGAADGITREPAGVAGGREVEVGVLGGAAGGELGVEERFLALGLGETHGELAAGGNIAIENVDDGVAGFGGGEPDFEDGVDLVDDRREDEWAAGEEDEDDGFAE